MTTATTQEQSFSFSSDQNDLNKTPPKVVLDDIEFRQLPSPKGPGL